jgi:hypothetical protein
MLPFEPRRGRVDVVTDRDDELSGRVIISFSRKLLSQIEDYRYGRRIPSRAEAIRNLIEAWLKATASTGSAACPAPKSKDKR